MEFPKALEKVLQHEGGYINHPSDPGGETNYGITKAVAVQYGYTGNMRNIPIDTVAKIYRRNYWDRIKADELPAAIRYPMFDAAVNSGPKQAVIWLQRALNTTVDGIIGPQTIAAARNANTAALAGKIIGYRLAMLADLKHFEQFGRGWSRRIASVLIEA